MSGLSPESVKEIFNQAVELPPEERTSFLDAACGADTPLRRRVEQLLKSLEDVGPFLASPTNNVRPDAPTRTASTPPPAAQIGTSIGPYKLLQQIGEGGFGVVYMAVQEQPVRRRVALKIIKLGMDTKQVIARFEAERQALAMMDHPNIARVLDAGATETGRPYFVMELVKGVAITEYCDTEDLSTAERLGLFMDVCRAVQHAHQKGVIHRDIKPSNVMVTLHDGKPVPKVIDFGIAKATQQRLTEKTMFTEYGQFIGSPAYMSPEQAEMSGLDVDTRSDIYSLGVLLYELLTGTTPLDPHALRGAAYAEIQRMIREEEAPAPSTRLGTLGDALPNIAKHRQAEPGALTRLIRGDLDWIVMKALEKNRSRRYESASELAADISRHFSNEPVVARPPSRIYRVRKFVTKHRAPVAAALILLGVISLGFGVSTILYFQAREAKDSEAQQRVLAERSSYIANLAAAAASLRSREVGDAKRRLAACKPGLRGWEWWHLHARSDQSLATLAGHDGGVNSVAASPDGRRIASGSEDRTIRVWDAASGKTLMVLEGHEHSVTSVAFSPDGTRIVSGSGDTTLRVWDAGSGESTLTLRGHDGGVVSVAFSPDGRRIASGSADTTIRLWDARSGESVATLKGHTRGVQPLLFTPDGARLVSASNDMTVRVWDTSSGRLLETFTPYEGFIFGIALAISPDGSRILTGSYDKAVSVWDATTGEAVAALDGHESIVTSIAMSPDGARIVSASGDGTIRIWDSSSGEHLATLVGHEEWIASVAFSSDGTRIYSASGDGTLRTWSATPSSWPTTLIDQGSQVNDVAVSPDGKRVASANRDKTVRVWDAGSGALIATLIGHEHRVTSVAFSPDAERIASASMDRTVRVWDVVSGDLLRTLEGHEHELWDVAFSPDGSRIASGSSHNVRVWDAVSGASVSVGKGLNLGGFSPDGTRIVSVSESEQTIRVWDASSGETFASWSVDLPLGPIVFSADGRQVLGSHGEDIWAWDAASGERLAAFVGDSWNASIGVFPDGSRIVTADTHAGQGAGSLRVWDFVTGESLLTLRGHEHQVRSVAVSQNGRRVVSGAVNGWIRIWDTSAEYQPPEIVSQE